MTTIQDLCAIVATLVTAAKATDDAAEMPVNWSLMWHSKGEFGWGWGGFPKVYFCVYYVP